MITGSVNTQSPVYYYYLLRGKNVNKKKTLLQTKLQKGDFVKNNFGKKGRIPKNLSLFRGSTSKIRSAPTQIVLLSQS